MQSAAARILNAIYEQDLLPCSFGYRPKLGPLDAAKDITDTLFWGKYTYIVEADAKVRHICADMPTTSSVPFGTRRMRQVLRSSERPAREVRAKTGREQNQDHQVYPVQERGEGLFRVPGV